MDGGTDISTASRWNVYLANLNPPSYTPVHLFSSWVLDYVDVIFPHLDTYIDLIFGIFCISFANINWQNSNNMFSNSKKVLIHQKIKIFVYNITQKHEIVTGTETWSCKNKIWIFFILRD